MARVIINTDNRLGFQSFHSLKRYEVQIVLDKPLESNLLADFREDKFWRIINRKTLAKINMKGTDGFLRLVQHSHRVAGQLNKLRY